jgi:sucrose phosphorylase
MIKKRGEKFQSYQLGSTYYSALRCNDASYLIARAVQFFAPGIPQVYYVGLLAGENDIEGMKTNPDPRTINRHTYSRGEIETAVNKPVCNRLFELMRFRNTYEAFNGAIRVGENVGDGTVTITWEKDEYHTTLKADFKVLTYAISYYDKATDAECIL